jgi:gamma-glutamylputrescine synthase
MFTNRRKEADDVAAGTRRGDLHEPTLLALSHAFERFVESTSCLPRIGVEIEFYLDADGATVRAQALQAIDAELRSQGVPVISVKPEIGLHQYEISLAPSTDPLLVALNVAHIKSVAAAISIRHGCTISFATRPCKSEPPSALQISVSLVDRDGNNPFMKKPGTEAETPAMQHAIAGLCELMNSSMIFFAPTAESYERFAAPFGEGFYRFANAPRFIAWGGNNRTVAIRIPTSTEDPASRHLEHRVPCSDANPALVIAAILAGISYGIEKRLPLRLQKVWGDASESDDAIPLHRSLNHAVCAYRNCFELQSRVGFQESVRPDA